GSVRALRKRWFCAHNSSESSRDTPRRIPPYSSEARRERVVGAALPEALAIESVLPLGVRVWEGQQVREPESKGPLGFQEGPPALVAVWSVPVLVQGPPEAWRLARVSAWLAFARGVQ